MNSKWTIFVGIFFLAVGIILKKTTELRFTPILLIVLGVLLKTYYIINKVKSGNYRPGYELMFLMIGLILFLSGIVLKTQITPIYTSILIFSGLALKVLFIVLIIVKLRSAKV